MTRNRDLANFGDNVEVPNSVLTNTLAAEDGSSPTELVKQSAAKAFARYNQVVTVVEDTLNVSSVNDNATGDHTYNWTNGFSDDGYSIVPTASDTGSTSEFIHCGNQSVNTGSFNTVIRDADGATSNVNFNNVIVHGTLA